MKKDETQRYPLRPWRVFVGLLGFLAVVFALIARSYIQHYSLSPGAVCALYLCFMTQLILAIAPGVEAARRSAGEWLGNGPRYWWLLVIWCLPYVIYAAGTGDWRAPAMARLLGIALPVIAIYKLLPVQDGSRFAPQDAAVSVLLIGSVLSHAMHGIWSVPANLDFLARLYLVTVAGWSWTLLRPVPELGYNFRFSQPVLRAATLNFGYFAIIAIPLGFSLNFISWHPRWRGIPVFLTDFLEIFLFVALLEEMFFRGFLQSLLSKSLGSWLKGQAVVSCLFGLFHILHAPFPNWRYVLLATVAGWFYGSAFRKGGNLMASSLTHALVDTVWRTFLTR